MSTSTSDLCSALIKAGVLSSRQAVDLLGRQVVRGGSLDTLLLEDRLISEGMLVRVLSEASGFRPMRTSWPENADPQARNEILRRVAQKLKVCPVSRHESRLTLLVAFDTCPVALEELAYELGRELVPLVAAEVRIAQAQQRVYRCSLSKRHAELLRRLGPTPVPPRMKQDTGLHDQLVRRPTRRKTERMFGSAQYAAAKALLQT